jgi:hypothetical protein
MDVEEIQLETIVVEDGRRVENSDQLKSLCNNINLSFHYNKKNFGPGSCRSLGASMSQEKFLWFIDSDTVTDNSKLMKNLLQTSLAPSGVSVRVIPEVVGYSSIATTQRYIDVNDNLICNCVEVFLQ